LAAPLDGVSFFELGCGQGLAVRLFKDAWFAKFAEKEGIGDKELKAAVEGIKHGGA
jgi:hypothetical protein